MTPTTTTTTTARTTDPPLHQLGPHPPHRGRGLRLWLVPVRVCRGLGPFRLRGVGGGPEGTPGNPPPAFGREVPPRRGRRGSRRFFTPLFAPGPAGGSPDIPSDRRTYAAVPPYRSPSSTPYGTPWQGPGHSTRRLGTTEVGAVTDGVTGRQPATLNGWRGCTGARPQDWSERRGNQLHVAASPAPRTGTGASPPTPAATTHPAKPQPPPTRTAPEASNGPAAPRRGAGNGAPSHNPTRTRTRTRTRTPTRRQTTPPPRRHRPQSPLVSPSTSSSAAR